MNPLKTLTSNGVSIWLDDLSRERIETGNLESLIESHSIRGVTTNPTIFAAALKGSSYTQAISVEAAKGSTAAQAIAHIEVEPGLAFDADGTVAQALELYKLVGRENVMIKIPATKAGLAAITEVTAHGISVNVTLIFSTTRYNEVIDAYFAGLEKAHANGIDLSKIHSVASFFVSRVDTEVDKRLEALGRPDLKSKAALANARLPMDSS
jgi:transaldolase